MAGFWRKCRITFRWCRIAVWLLVLAMLGALLWFNQIGLPDFLKTQLVAALREKGVELGFSRMRLSLVRGLVADHVAAGQSGSGTNAGPAFTARLVELELDFPELWHRRLALNGLLLRDGVLTLPVSPTNVLALTNLQAALRFETNDVWTLDQLSASFAGCNININGSLTHARKVLAWEIFQRGASESPGGEPHSLQPFADWLQQIEFQGTPQLHVTVAGDASDIHSVKLRLDANADGVRTPWFAARKFHASAALNAPAAIATNLDASWGFWTNLQPFRLAWSAQLDALRSRKINLDLVNCSGLWQAPTLLVSNFAARLGAGEFAARAQMDVPTRRLTVNGHSSIFPDALSALLPEAARTGLARIRWTEPPQLRVEASLRLPPWTNSAAGSDLLPKVTAELAVTNVTALDTKLDRMQLRVHYADEICDVTDLSVQQARTQLRLGGQFSTATRNFHFLVSGALDPNCLRHYLKNTNALNGFNHLTFNEPARVTLDVAGNLRQLETLSATGQVALADFAIRGQALEHLATDVTYSNLTAVFIHPQVSRANGMEHFTADRLTLDLAGERLYFVNGYAHVEPMAVGRAIGPKTAEAMEPYQFLAVPTAHVNGCVPLREEKGDLVLDDADMRFDIEGTAPFRWKRFETPAITGTIRWWKNWLVLTNASTACYSGMATGWGAFDLKTPGEGTDFSFYLRGTNVDFHQMGLALWSPTNHLEGQLSGEVLITKANSADWRTWNGSGAAELKNGLLWDVPIFALMSPVLNAFSPGLGNSRATEAKGGFILTNGVVATDSLIIQAQSMRLEYVGTVDLQENVNARVTARLLRNMPVIGSVMSFVLTPVSKIFECRVSGQLSEPAVTPVYIPKILLVPLHPIRSLEELFSGPAKTNAPETNAPPAK